MGMVVCSDPTLLHQTIKLRTLAIQQKLHRRVAEPGTIELIRLFEAREFLRAVATPSRQVALHSCPVQCAEARRTAAGRDSDATYSFLKSIRGML